MNMNEEKNLLTMKSEPFKDGGFYKALFLCKCGVEKIIRVSTVESGHTKSCGCYNRKSASERITKSNTKYINDVKHPLYQQWKLCEKRGGLCEEWKNYDEFYNNLIELWEPKCKIRRIDDSLPYSISNLNILKKKEKVVKEKVVREKKNPYIKVICDYCGVEFEKKPFKLKKSIEIVNKVCCNDTGCMMLKRGDVNEIKYGVRFPQSLDSVKQKLSENSTAMSPEASAKRAATNLEKYGSDNPFSNKEIQEKIKSTNLEKYGVEYVAQNEEIREKQKQTLMENYGVDSPLKSPEINAKMHNTMVERYGVEHYSETDKFKEELLKINRKYNGKTLKELAEEAGKNYSTFVEHVNKFGLDYAIQTEKKRSGIEYKMKVFLDSLNIPYKEQVKIDNRRLDFLINDIAIEVDGLYWHNEEVIEDRQYHYKKKKLYSEQGWTSLFFREDEVLNKFEIVKSIILNKLGQSERIFARKCEIREVNKKDRKEFFENNHLMGKSSGNAFGLYFDNKLVACMQYILKKNEIHIQRFCTLLNTSVIGGFSRLLKQIEQKEKANKVVNFVDLRYGSGKQLLKMGFIKEKQYLSFNWTDYKNTFHRSKFKANTGYQFNLLKIWDCGQAKYIKNLT